MKFSRMLVFHALLCAVMFRRTSAVVCGYSQTQVSTPASFQFTVPVDATQVTFTTCGSSIDSRISVFAGTSTSRLAYADSNTCPIFAESLSMAVTPSSESSSQVIANNSYRIEVSLFSSLASGNVNFAVQCALQPTAGINPTISPIARPTSRQPTTRPSGLSWARGFALNRASDAEVPTLQLIGLAFGPIVSIGIVVLILWIGQLRSFCAPGIRTSGTITSKRKRRMKRGVEIFTGRVIFSHDGQEVRFDELSLNWDVYDSISKGDKMNILYSASRDASGQVVVHWVRMADVKSQSNASFIVGSSVVACVGLGFALGFSVFIARFLGGMASVYAVISGCVISALCGACGAPCFPPEWRYYRCLCGCLASTCGDGNQSMNEKLDIMDMDANKETVEPGRTEPSAVDNEVADWISGELDLPMEYGTSLIKNGFDKMDIVLELIRTKEDLVGAIGGHCKPGHLMFILGSIEKRRQSAPSAPSEHTAQTGGNRETGEGPPPYSVTHTSY